jgi:hypothetical protein
VPPPFRYQDFVDEQRSGLIHGVFVDDTGSPGLQTGPGNLHPKRKSWAAVIVERRVIAEVWDQLPRAVKELHSILKASEFHFSDIYAGRREFKHCSLQERLAIFEFMAYIFSVYKFPIFIQTFDPKTLASFRAEGQFPEQVGPFNLRKPEDTALFLLILRVKWYLEQNYRPEDRQARIFVDEGFKRNGAAIKLPSLSSIFRDGLICFAKSDSILPIQLADFAAFCVNRMQLLLGRARLSDLDLRIYRDNTTSGA